MQNFTKKKNKEQKKQHRIVDFFFLKQRSTFFKFAFKMAKQVLWFSNFSKFFLRLALMNKYSENKK